MPEGFVDPRNTHHRSGDDDRHVLACLDNSNDARSSQDPRGTAGPWSTDARTARGMDLMGNSGGSIFRPVAMYMTAAGPKTPQKKISSNMSGLFRPFETPPKNISKVEIDSNNNNNSGQFPLREIDTNVKDYWPPSYPHCDSDDVMRPNIHPSRDLARSGNKAMTSSDNREQPLPFNVSSFADSLQTTGT